MPNPSQPPLDTAKIQRGLQNGSLRYQDLISPSEIRISQRTLNQQLAAAKSDPVAAPPPVKKPWYSCLCCCSKKSDETTPLVAAKP